MIMGNKSMRYVSDIMFYPFFFVIEQQYYCYKKALDDFCKICIENALKDFVYTKSFRAFSFNVTDIYSECGGMHNPIQSTCTTCLTKPYTLSDNRYSSYLLQKIQIHFCKYSIGNLVEHVNGGVM